MTQKNLTKTLQELDAIVAWFDAQEDVDIEEGLEKVKSGVQLVKSAKKRLAEVENTFEEITKDIREE
jgi:exodeoxyribonuclease VII small subunit